MSTPKSKKSELWIECDSCSATFLNKDVEKHSRNCPSNLKTASHSYVRNGSFVGQLDVKKNEEIKGLTMNEIENLVFLSESTMQLCGLSIGDWAVVEVENVSPIVKKVWPTVEKSLTSVLMTQNVLDLHLGESNSYSQVSVSKLILPVNVAQRISLLLIGNTKLDFNQDLVNRLSNTYRERILGLDNNISIFYFGKVLKFVVQSITTTTGGSEFETQFENLSICNKTFFKVSQKTLWTLYNDKNEYDEQVCSQNPLLKIGGLSDEIAELKEIFDALFTPNTNFKKFKSVKSVLLYGNPGTGKTLLANALAKENGSNTVSISAPDLYSKYSSNPEETMKVLFLDAIENSPSIIILDEVDLLCPLRSSRITETDKRVVSTLLLLLDKLHENLDAKVFIIATTNKIDSIDPCFRRCGRFEREIEIPTPNPKSRRDILEKLLNDVEHKLDEVEIAEISSKTHGFVGADLVSLCSRAAMHASRQKRHILEYGDLTFALAKVSPSAMREVQIEVPNVKWSDIGGQEKLKLILKQAVEWPLKHPESFVRLGITPPKGVLMFGPPGCSKTMIAKALATESGLNFLSIKGPELFSKWVGESERAVREVFRKARQVAPSVIFFDEIDALGGERGSGSSTTVQERVLAQLLTELDGVTPLGDVTILAATNRPDRIDKALLRPGRLDRIVYVPLPDRNTRRDIFRLKLQKMPVEGVDIEALVDNTENYSGAEVNAVCHEAAMKALEDDIEAEVVDMEHFEMALDMIKPRTPTSLIQLYEEYNFKNI